MYEYPEIGTTFKLELKPGRFSHSAYPVHLAEFALIHESCHPRRVDSYLVASRTQTQLKYSTNGVYMGSFRDATNEKYHDVVLLRGKLFFLEWNMPLVKENGEWVISGYNSKAPLIRRPPVDPGVVL